MYEQYQLNNGVNVILVPQHDTRSTTTLVMYPVGSRHETNKMAGVSHYVEHLMFKGTKKRKNTQILTREIDRLGAEYNAFTGKEYTGYYIKVDADYTQTSLDILSDMLFNSVFDPKEMEREKGPIVEEIRMYNDNPLMNIDNIFEDVLYAGCPLGRDIAGTEKHVLGYKRPDVLAYKKKHYQPRNMTVVIAGRIDEYTAQWIEQYFGKAKNTNRSSGGFKPFVWGPKTKQGRIDVQHKKTEQAQLMIGFPGFRYTASQNPAATVMNTILGGSMSSRLFIQIRERRGLAYTVRSGTEKFQDTGYAYIRAGLEVKNINKAIRVMMAEAERIATKRVSCRELDDAKTHLRGRLSLSMEDTSSVANWYARQALFMKNIKTPEDSLKKIDAVTKEDIRTVAEKIFRPQQMRVAVIGDVAVEDIVF